LAHWRASRQWHPAERVKLTAAESLKHMLGFSKRKERFIAAVRKGKDRGGSAC